MEQANFGALNYAVVVAYFILVIALALRLSGRQKDTQSFFLARRRMPWLAVSVSVVASMLSAITYLGSPAVVYRQNAALMLGVLAGLAATPLVIILFLPIYQRLNIISVYEYLSWRFGNSARYVASALAILKVQGWLGIALFAPALVLSTVTGIQLTWAVLLMGLVATGYTCLGGMAAVIWTDVIQFVILSGGAVLVAISLTSNVPGGLHRISEIVLAENKLGLGDFSFSFTEMTVMSVVICNFIIAFEYGSNQVVMQRLFATRSLPEMIRALMLNRVLEFLLGALLCLIGLGLFAYFYVFPERLAEGISGDRLLPFYIIHALPAGLSGLLIAAVFAAAMSTVDSGIHSNATLILTDFVHPLKKIPLTERQSLALARVLTAVLGLWVTITALFFSDQRGILEAMSQVGSYTAAPLTALFLLGVLTRRGHFWGWVAATLIVALPLSLYVQNPESAYSVHWLYYGPISLLSCLLGSYLFSLPLRRLLGAGAHNGELTIWKDRG